MSAYADTGFVVSLYKVETTSASAAATMQGLTGPVWLSPLVELEFRNAMQLAVFRGEISAGAAGQKWTLFQGDIGHGVHAIRPVPQAVWFARAGELADRYSARLGTRSLDLMHVAAALLLGAGEFLSFDHRQRDVAAGEGIRLLP